MTTDRIKARLWLPESARAARRKYRCRLCQNWLGEDEYQQHVVNCANRWDHELREESPRVKHPGLFGRDGSDGTDWEFLHWHRERGTDG